MGSASSAALASPALPAAVANVVILNGQPVLAQEEGSDTVVGVPVPFGEPELDRVFQRAYFRAQYAPQEMQRAQAMLARSAVTILIAECVLYNQIDDSELSCFAYQVTCSAGRFSYSFAAHCQEQEFVLETSASPVGEAAMLSRLLMLSRLCATEALVSSPKHAAPERDGCGSGSARISRLAPAFDSTAIS